MEKWQKFTQKVCQSSFRRRRLESQMFHLLSSVLSYEYTKLRHKKARSGARSDRAGGEKEERTRRLRERKREKASANGKHFISTFRVDNICSWIHNSSISRSHSTNRFFVLSHSIGQDREFFTMDQEENASEKGSRENQNQCKRESIETNMNTPNIPANNWRKKRVEAFNLEDELNFFFCFNSRNFISSSSQRSSARWPRKWNSWNPIVELELRIGLDLFEVCRARLILESLTVSGISIETDFDRTQVMLSWRSDLWTRRKHAH